MSDLAGQKILLIDKPQGITSFDVIRILRRQLGIRKMGHAGTLDPLATGLMIIGVAQGTKKLAEFLKLPKTYEAEILLGLETDTGDLEGRVVRREKVPALTRASLERLIKELVGRHDLPVPVYSAIKKQGQPLYKLARKGQLVEPPVKTMGVRAAKLLGFRQSGETAVLNVELDVASGTYIRSLAVEIGRRLGTPATVQALRRTRIGNYSVADATALSQR